MPACCPTHAAFEAAGPRGMPSGCCLEPGPGPAPTIARPPMQSQLAGSRPIIMGPHACLFRMRPAAPHRRPTRCPAALAAPAEVQKRAAPVILDGDDCIIQSETGSGKTLAFLLPLVMRVRQLKQQEAEVAEQAAGADGHTDGEDGGPPEAQGSGIKAVVVRWAQPAWCLLGAPPRLMDFMPASWLADVHACPVRLSTRLILGWFAPLRSWPCWPGKLCAAR